MEIKTPIFSIALPRQEKRRTLLKKLRDDSGVWVEEQGQIESLANNYFASLFSAGIHVADEAVLQKVQPRVNQRMNNLLMTPYTREEVKKGSIQYRRSQSARAGWAACNIL
jgi:hypothetical protein